jgi:hypothetical protein
MIFIERDRRGARTQEELEMSNNFPSHFSADDAALVLIDFQPQMFMGVESHDRNARYPTSAICLPSSSATSIATSRSIA